MKKMGKVVSLNSLNFSFILKLDRVRAVLYLTSGIGLLLGFILFSSSGNSGIVAKTVFDAIVVFKAREDVVTSFLIVFGSLLSVILCNILFGSSVFGVVITPLLILTVNGLFGTVLAYSYSTYRISGLAFNSVMLIPTYSVFLIALIVSSSAIMKYSLYQLRLLSKNTASKCAVEFSVMLKKQLIVFGIIIALSIVEVMLNRLLIGSFSFV